MINASLKELAAALASRKISSVELTQLFLERINRLNPEINAYITVDAEKSLAQAKAADEARRQQGVDPKKNPAQVPTADPDCHVMPNKEGGFSPNYTPVATTDATGGFIVDADVLAEIHEGGAAAVSVDRIEET